MNALSSTLALAHTYLSEDYPRARYAHDVLAGRRRWSGADLKGKARSYGGGYARQREHAHAALVAAGGCVVPIAHGRLVSAVIVGQDDYGNALADCGRHGMRIAAAHSQWVRV